MIFGFLMIVAGLGMAAGSLRESVRAKSRTSVIEAHVLTSHQTMMGIGPLRHYSINAKYEFFADGVRIEKEQLVDNLPSGVVYVQYDPGEPHNNGLALPNSAPRFLGMIAVLLIFAGTGLTLRFLLRSHGSDLAAPLDHRRPVEYYD